MLISVCRLNNISICIMTARLVLKFVEKWFKSNFHTNFKNVLKIVQENEKLWNLGLGSIFNEESEFEYP